MFKEMEVPTSAAARQTPVGAGSSLSPAPGGGYAGYPRGQGYSPDVVPAELSGKFNWGALLWTWIWGLNHRAFKTLLSLGLGVFIVVLDVVLGVATKATPGEPPRPAAMVGGFVILGLCVVYLGLAIWYGAKGYEWSWKSGRFSIPDECRRCQAIWGWWGLGVWLFTCGCGAVLLATVFAAAFAAMRGIQTH